MRANVSGRINSVSAGSYIPALRIRALTRFYDPVVALTTREREFKQRMIDQLGPATGQRILDPTAWVGGVITQATVSQIG